MADVKISQLPEVSSVSPGDVMPVVASGDTSKIQIQNFANSITASNAISASYAATASYALNNQPEFPYTGSAIISGALIVTGSINSSAGFTGSLLGTSSWSINSVTSSFVTGSNVYGPFGSNSVQSASYSVTSSNALTASYVLNVPQTFPYTGSAIITGSLIVTGSVTSTTGFTGSLLGSSSWAQNSITSSYVTGSIFNSSNLALSSSYAISSSLSVSSSYAVSAVTSSFSNNFNIGTTNLNSQLNFDVDIGSEVIATVTTGSYFSAFFDYIVTNEADYRCGTVFSVWNRFGSIRYTDFSTTDIGDTSAVVLSTNISGGTVQLIATVSSNNWIVKSFVRTI